MKPYSNHSLDFNIKTKQLQDITKSYRGVDKL